MPMPFRSECPRLFRQAPALSGVVALVLALAGCSSGGGAPAAPAPQPSAAPPPGSVPPAPAPSPVPPPAPSDPLIAGVPPGGKLGGALVCAGATLELQALGDGTRQVRGISAIKRVKLTDNRVDIDYRAADSFGLDFNGFGGPSFGPSDSRGSVTGVYDYFRASSEELEIDSGKSGLQFASFGRVSDENGICFFAVGRPTYDYLIDGDYEFRGVSDGLFVSANGGGTRRLYGSFVNGTIRANAGVIDVTIQFTGRDDAFGDFQARAPIDLGVATASIPYTRASFSVAPISGPDGATGTITGQFYETIDLGFVFEMTYPNGDRVFGAIGTEFLSTPM